MTDERRESSSRDCELQETDTVYSDAHTNTTHVAHTRSNNEPIPNKHNTNHTNGEQMYPDKTQLCLSQLRNPEEYEICLERRNRDAEDDTLAIHIRDTVRLKQYSVTIAQPDVQQMHTIPTPTVSFLHTVLFDVFHSDVRNEAVHPTVPLKYEVCEPQQSQKDYFLFTIHNTYKYAPFSFGIRVPQQTLTETENIQLRLDKILTENESLRTQLNESEQASRTVSKQLDSLRADVHYLRDVERYRHGFTLDALDTALAPLFEVCKAHWTTTRSFGGLDVACPSSSTQQTPVHSTILEYKSMCAGTTPTYRSIAQRIIDLYEEHNDVPIKSYQLPFKRGTANETPSNAPRIVHHLTNEKATRVRVRLVVPRQKGVVGSTCGVKPSASTLTSIFPTRKQSAYDGSGRVINEECREWILFWNKVEQLWELEAGNVASIKYPTASELQPEWRAQGVHHEFDVLEWETED